MKPRFYLLIITSIFAITGILNCAIADEIDDISALINDGNFTEAMAVCKICLGKNGCDDQALALMAQCQLAIGDTNQAYLSIEQAIELAPECADHYRIRGDVFSAMGNTDAAAMDVIKAMELKRKPKNRVTGKNNPSAKQLNLPDLTKVLADDLIPIIQEVENYLKANDLALAEQCLDMATDLAKSKKDPNQKLFIQMAKLAYYSETDQYAKAWSLFSRKNLVASKKLIHLYLTGHPGILKWAGYYREKGTQSQKAGDLPLARTRFEQAVAISELVEEENSPLLKTTRTSLDYCSSLITAMEEELAAGVYGAPKDEAYINRHQSAEPTVNRKPSNSSLEMGDLQRQAMGLPPADSTGVKYSKNGLTYQSEAAKRLDVGMSQSKVESILGLPDKRISARDDPDLAEFGQGSIIFELIWSNPGGRPITVAFGLNGKVNGWDGGQ